MTRKLLLPLLAAAALALPAAAAAHDGWHWHHPALFAKLSGTGGSLAGASATETGQIASDMLGAGTFSATVTTNWAGATTRTGERGALACAPATATLTLNGAAAANTASLSLTGRTCTWTPAGSTTVAGSMFRGKDTSLAAAGAAAGLNGTSGKAFLFQKADGTVRGAVMAGFERLFSLQFAVREHEASHHTGDCDRR